MSTNARTAKRTSTKWKLWLLAAFFVGVMLASIGGCSFHSEDLGLVHVEPPRGIEWHIGKPADIFAGGRALAHGRAKRVPREIVEDDLRDVRP